MIEWRDKAQRLAENLRRSGDLVSPHWHDAVCAVPRHVLVPAFYGQNEDASWQRHTDSNDDVEIWLDTIYSDQTLITALTELPPNSPGSGYMAVSSSTMPSLMVRMLEALDIHDGHRVLEIGTGTGYNAALLSERLGSDHVVTIDVDPALANLARERLHDAGYTPTVLTGDGADGCPQHAPYDRIIATCAVHAIPAAWIDQTTDGGLILADLKIRGLGGNLVLLARLGTTATGRFLPEWAGFMNIRRPDPTGTATPARHPRHDHATARPPRPTTVPAQAWDHTVPWFLAMLTDLPPNLTYGWLADGGTWLSTTDGSWCEVHITDTGEHQLIEGGPESLWNHIERGWDQWRAAGEPTWSQLGLTVTPHEHRIWLGDPDGHSWSVSIADGTAS